MKFRSWLALSAAIFSPVAAQAFEVSNLDKVAHTLVIHQPGNIQHVVIEPNGIYRGPSTPSHIKVKGEKLLYAAERNEFAIWPGGKLRIQKYRKFEGER